jgi:hypothetical protein
MQRKFRKISPILRSLTLPRLSTAGFVLLWAGVAVHVLTVFLAFRVADFLSASLSALFPGAAQVYWVVALWQRSGTFWHPFTIACAAYLALWLILSLARR